MARTGYRRAVMVSAAVVFAGLAAVALVLVAPPKPAEAAFPGENGRIAFENSEQTAPFDIWTMKTDGTDRKNVTNDSARDGDPAYSPDGKNIAYESYYCDTQDCANGIFVVDANGTEEPKRLTNNLGSSSIRDYDPTWSPDGTKIAFTSNRDHHAPGDYDTDIYVMNADGTNPTRLTHDSDDLRVISDPDWSPDGKKIAFYSYSEGVYQSEIYAMNADGTGLENLTNTPGREEFGPRWSPDSAKIAYYDVDGYYGNGEDIWVMNADGTDQKNLTNTTHGRERGAAWSPDGLEIAFSRFSHTLGSHEIWTMRASDGLLRTNKTNTPESNEAKPDWAVTVDDVPDPPSDTTAPWVTSVEPSEGERGMPRNTSVTATFSEGMDPATLDAENVKLLKAGTRKPVEATVSCQGETCETVTLDPSGRLERGTRYRAIVTTGAEDEAGNALAERKVWYFTTGRR